MSGLRSTIHGTHGHPETVLAHVEAMAHLARESNLTVHVVVGRGPGVVEHARDLARELGLDCAADLRARTVRIRFAPLPAV